MDEHFQNLTTMQIEGQPEGVGFIQVGIVRQVERNTIMYLHADRNGNQYEPSISIFSFGKRIAPMDNCPYCFDLIMQVGITVCVRGLKYDIHGRPQSFLIETYRPKKLALVETTDTAPEHLLTRQRPHKAPVLRRIK